MSSLHSGTSGSLPQSAEGSVSELSLYQSGVLADDIVQHPYAWPGGYPRYAITDDCAALCKHCCAAEQKAIRSTDGTDGWCVISTAINWEDPELHCNNCGNRIESAYAEV